MTFEKTGELTGTIVSAIGLLTTESYEKAVRETFKDFGIVNHPDRLGQFADILFLILNCYWFNTEWKEDWNGEEPEITDQTLIEEAKSLDERYGGEPQLMENLCECVSLLLNYGVISKDWKTQTFHLNRDFLEEYETALNNEVDYLYTEGQFKTLEGIEEYHSKEVTL